MGRHANRGGEAGNGATAAPLRGGSGALTPSAPVRALLAGAIDYAGLFPPASLKMPDAAAQYARHLAGPDAWALGRFVVPLARLDELAGEVGSSVRIPLPCSIVAGPDEDITARTIDDARARVHGRLALDAIEQRDGSGVRTRLHGMVASSLEVYVELAPDEHVDEAVAVLGAANANAKIRTGGVTPDAFPDARDVVRFLRACQRHEVRFKATAGLHHPIRGEYHLTYAAESDSTTMFGYLNVMLAAALVLGGHDDGTVLSMLNERSADAFAISGDALQWQSVSIDRELLQRTRDRFIAGFGSCSFHEPLDELPASLARAA